MTPEETSSYQRRAGPTFQQGGIPSSHYRIREEYAPATSTNIPREALRARRGPLPLITNPGSTQARPPLPCDTLSTVRCYRSETIPEVLTDPTCPSSSSLRNPQIQPGGVAKHPTAGTALDRVSSQYQAPASTQ